MSDNRAGSSAAVVVQDKEATTEIEPPVHKLQKVTEDHLPDPFASASVTAAVNIPAPVEKPKLKLSAALLSKYTKK